MSRGRAARILFGIAFLAIGVTVITPYLFNTISTDAVINARVIPLVAPIRGTIQSEPPKAGVQVRRGAVLVSIADPRVDRTEFDRLRLESAGLDERIAAQRQVLVELEALQHTLKINQLKFRTATEDVIAHRLAEANAALATAVSEYDRTEKQFQRRSRLRAKGFVSAAAMDAMIAAAERARQDVLRRRAERDGLATELRAVRDGVFADSGRNDAPYSQQRLDEITLRKIDVRAQIRELRIRTDEFRKALAVERTRFRNRSSATITAPIEGVVWRKIVHKGATVAPNERVISLLDCSNLILHVPLGERHFEDVRPGDTARVLLIGSSEEFTARVISLRGMGANRREELLAAELPPLGGDQFLVTLTIDGRDLTDRANRFCHVGRNAEVRFRHKSNFLGWFLAWFSSPRPPPAQITETAKAARQGGPGA